VLVDPARPAPEWELSDEGRSDAAALATSEVWRAVSGVATSPEPKALETARPIAAAAGVSPVAEPDLREVERDRMPVVGPKAYAQAVGEYFRNERDDWEPREEATARIVRCINRLPANTTGPFCVVSHGLVLSLFLAEWARRPLSLDEWAAIPLPAVAIVDLAGRSLVTPFLSARAFLDA